MKADFKQLIIMSLAGGVVQEVVFDNQILTEHLELAIEHVMERKSDELEYHLFDVTGQQHGMIYWDTCSDSDQFDHCVGDLSITDWILDLLPDTHALRKD